MSVCLTIAKDVLFVLRGVVEPRVNASMEIVPNYRAIRWYSL
jgi:hypothetical protein